MLLLLATLLFVNMTGSCSSGSSNTPDTSEKPSLEKSAPNFVRVDPLKKLLPENSQLDSISNSYEIAAGEHAVFQFSVHNDKAIKNLRVSSSDLTSADGSTIRSIKLGFVGYVSEGKKMDTPASDMLVSNSNRYPDPIYTDNSVDVDANTTQSVWATVTTQNSTAPGTYKGTIRFRGEVGSETFDVRKEYTLTVYPVQLQEPDFILNNWFWESEQQLKVYNNGTEIKRYSDAYFDYLTKLATLMKDIHQNCILMIINYYVNYGYNPNNNTYSFDFSNFDRVIDVFKNTAGIKYVSATLNGYKDEEHDEILFTIPVYSNGQITMTQCNYSDSRTLAFLDQFIPAFEQHMKDIGFENHTFLQINDEPSNYMKYNTLAQRIRRLAPSLKLMDAVFKDNMRLDVDVDVPLLDLIDRQYSYYKQRQAQGHTLWFYNSSSPQGEYANRFIALPLIKTRVLGWIAFKYGMTGYLHWGLNYWNYDDPNNSWVKDGIVGGDPYLIYAKDRKIYSSIRSEAVRDGVEDYTLLEMLSKKNPTLAQELCSKIVRGWSSYDTNSSDFYAVRHQILEALK